MKLKISHETSYRFDSPIFLEPHYLRFRPLNRPYKNLEQFSLDVIPKPAGLSPQTDPENNISHFCWFDGLHDQLQIKSASIIDSRPYNPFNFIIHPQQYQLLPFDYPDPLNLLLKPCLQRVIIGDAISQYAKNIQKKAKNDTTQFLTELTRHIHNDFALLTREFGEPQDPDQTFKLKNGSCRDLTWMQIHILRHHGIAARFVSGYYYVDEVNPIFELHAWLEAFLPGVGWMGLDPSHGIVIQQSHIPVAASSHYENTMPVTGTLRGLAASRLASKLEITRLS